MNLTDAYELAAGTPSDIYEHVPVLASYASQAQVVIELGTRTGVSTVAFLHGLPADGELWSVDIDPQPNLGFTDARWTFVQGDDCDPDIADQLPTADVVFIDTSHDYRHTLAELNLYQWFVNPGGIIVLHDTELPHPDGVIGPPYPVKKAVTEFCDAKGWEWENRTNCFGLGVIRVP